MYTYTHRVSWELGSGGGILTWSSWVTRPSRCVTVHMVREMESESSAARVSSAQRE